MADERAREILAELDRIASSAGFAGAGRLAPFLRHLVERALEGELSRLKESVLGVEFFGRPADYDPRLDPIVRVEARRLRLRLDEYYASASAAGPLRIALPKGSYVPAFSAQTGGHQLWRSLRVWRMVLLATGLVALLGGAGWFALHRGRAETPALAVMPFANLSQDPSDEYFSDGLTEEMINAISHVGGLRVAARSLTFQYKGKAVDVRRLGAELGVTHVVEGSVRRSGNRVRVAAQLVSVASGYQIWSRAYDREARDLFGIQEEVARGVTGALRVRLGRPARDLFAGRYTENLEAYNHFLLARYLLNRFTHESATRGIEELETVLKLDPRYAPALANLSTIHALLGYYGEMPEREAWGKAKTYAGRAIDADPALAEAYAALSFTAGMHDWDWKTCETNGRRAIDLDPASADARCLYAVACLAPRGRMAEAERELKQALELDPLTVFGNFTYAFTLLVQDRYEQAAAQYRKTLDLKSDHPDFWWDYGMALGYAGKREEAAKAFARGGAMREGDKWTPGPSELALMGRMDEARLLARLLAKDPRRFEHREMDLARALAMTGDTDGALSALERAVATHEAQAVWLKVDPRLAAVRGSARHEALLAKMGL